MLGAIIVFPLFSNLYVHNTRFRTCTLHISFLCYVYINCIKCGTTSHRQCKLLSFLPLVVDTCSKLLYIYISIDAHLVVYALALFVYAYHVVRSLSTHFKWCCFKMEVIVVLPCVQYCTYFLAEMQFNDRLPDGNQSTSAHMPLCREETLWLSCHIIL